jgi:hypothetical protein
VKFHVWFPFVEGEERGLVLDEPSAGEAAERYMELYAEENPVEAPVYGICVREISMAEGLGPTMRFEVRVEEQAEFYFSASQLP